MVNYLKPPVANNAPAASAASFLNKQTAQATAFQAQPTNTAAAVTTTPVAPVATQYNAFNAQQNSLQSRLSQQADFRSGLNNLNQQAVNKRQAMEAQASALAKKQQQEQADRQRQVAGNQNNAQGNVSRVSYNFSSGSNGQGGARQGNDPYPNGQIPTSALSRVSFSPGAMFRADAAQGMEALNSAFRSQFGTNIGINDSYRSLAGQVAASNKFGRMAAVPGTSNHGRGVATDLGSGINNPNSPQSAWMRANAANYGWANPTWAKGTKFEPWHWEFTG
jgi:hypothetical protein